MNVRNRADRKKRLENVVGEKEREREERMIEREREIEGST